MFASENEDLQPDPLPPASKLPVIVGSVNCALGKSDLQVDACYAAYGGLTLLTTRIANQTEIDLVSNAIVQILALPMPVSASLPTS
jgi:hypothetical protein